MSVVGDTLHQPKHTSAPTPAVEGREVATKIGAALPRQISGQDATLQMKELGGQWRQMEWPAFFTEFRVAQIMESTLGARPGPTIGNMSFDLQRSYVWDLKVHTSNAGKKAPLNDRLATLECLSDYGGLGYIIVSGTSTPDTDGTFKLWQDQLKGKPSAYVQANQMRGASHRMRKAAFSFQEIHVIWFADHSDLELAQHAGAVTGFQENFRNSNQKPRRGKFLLDLDKLPGTLEVARIPIH